MSDSGQATTRSGRYLIELLVVSALLLTATLWRLPGLERDFTGFHAWKNIRHYELATEMRRTGNPLFGNLSWAHPDVDARWESRITESPLVTWALVGAFEIGGRSYHVHYMTFLVIAVLTLALLYGVLRPHLGSVLAGTAVLLVALTPLSAYFACYSIGENLLHAAQISLLLTVAALARGATRGRLAALAAVLVLFVLCKLTTGAIHGLVAGALVGAWLLWRERRAAGAWAARHPWVCVSVAAALLVAGAVGAWKWTSVMRSWLLVDQLVFLDAAFYDRLHVRWVSLVGEYLLVAAALSLAAYVLLLPLGVFWRRARLSVIEGVTLVLTLAALAGAAVQGIGTLNHEYYLLPCLIPAVLLPLCLIRRLGTRLHPAIGVLGLAALLVGFAVEQPARQRQLAWMNRHQTMPVDERDALEHFFASKRAAREEYFVIARGPYLTHHAGVLMVLRWDWPALTDSLSLEEPAASLLRDLGIEYVVYPLDVLPESVRENLRTDPLIDPGPGHWKLGLVLRTQQVAVFRICQGVAWREALPGTASPPDPTAWRALGHRFGPPRQVDGRPVFISGGWAAGALLVGPFAPRGDALLYRVRGARQPGLRVELGRDGEALYRQSPAWARPKETELFAMDLTAAGDEDVYLLLVDGHAEGGQLEVSDLDLIAYEPLPWLSGGTEARDEP